VGGACGTYRVEKRNVYRVLVMKPEEKRYLEDLGIDWRIILQLMLNKQDRNL
jgi:hypothetical protein